MDNRDRILAAAARVYAELGFRGATTRRIADQAGVNEVTLFRLFGSKTALITEALRLRPHPGQIRGLPDHPVDPPRELTAWVTTQLGFMRQQRALLLTTMSELAERPEFSDCACEGPERAHRDLRRYLARLTKLGWLQADRDHGAAVAMLLGALFADAVGRDPMPEYFPRPLTAAPRAYTRLFLRAIGLRARRGSTNGRNGAGSRKEQNPAARAATSPSPRRRHTTIGTLR